MCDEGRAALSQSVTDAGVTALAWWLSFRVGRPCARKRTTTDRCGDGVDMSTAGGPGVRRRMYGGQLKLV